MWTGIPRMRGTDLNEIAYWKVAVGSFLTGGVVAALILAMVWVLSGPGMATVAAFSIAVIAIPTGILILYMEHRTENTVIHPEENNG